MTTVLLSYILHTYMSNETRIKQQSTFIRALHEAVHSKEIEKKKKYAALRTEIAQRKRQLEDTHTNNK